MSKYLFMVYGPTAENEADRGAGMADIAEWYKSPGLALVDPGAPFIGASTVSGDGIENGAIGPNASGYNFIQAPSLAAAAELARGCPLLKHARRISVFEIFDPMR